MATYQLEQLSQFGQIFQLNLIKIGYIDFERQVDMPKQVFAVKFLIFDKVRVISAPQILREIGQRPDILDDFRNNLAMIGKNLFEPDAREMTIASLY